MIVFHFILCYLLIFFVAIIFSEIICLWFKYLLVAKYYTFMVFHYISKLILVSFEHEGVVLHEPLNCSLDIEPQQPPRDPLLQLVSLQKASGCWELDPALAAAVGKTSEEVENTKPASVGYYLLI